MVPAMSQGELAAILRARAIPVSDSHLEAVLRDGDEGQQLARWAATHCTEDTLLTLDELELYDALQRSGLDQTLVNGQYGGQGQTPAAILPLREADLRAALAALEKSTAMINKQTDVLRQQQDALARLAVRLGASSQSEPRAESTAAGVQKRWDATRADLVADVKRSAAALGERVDDLSLQNSALSQRVQQTVNSLCESDDTLLASLQKLGRVLPAVPHAGDAGDEYERQQQQQQKSIARLRDSCLNLIKLGVETIRTRLDWMYLETLKAGEAGEVDEVEGKITIGRAPPATEESVAVLQAELESLYTEILPVAQMSVEQQHLDPALRSLSGQNMKDLTRVLLALDYVDDCLAYLLEHIALLAVRIDTAAAHHVTTEAILATARTELAAPVPQALSVLRKAAGVEHRRRLSNYGSPAHKRHSGGSGSLKAHLRTRSSTVGGSGSMMSAAELKAQRRRSSGFGYGSVGADSMGETTSSIDQLLEALSLVLPMDEPGPDETATTAAIDSAACMNVRFLQTVLADRTEKAYGVASNAQEAFEMATTAHLTDARRALALARTSVLAESPFGDVQLVDEEIGGSMAVMSDEVARLRQRRAAVETELGRLRKLCSSKRDQIVNRWYTQE